MEEASFLTISETALRIIFGLRFLSSGVSNIIRWPHATDTARVVFPMGSWFFGLIAVFLMTAGGLAMALGLLTRISAAMILVFLLPTFVVHARWRRKFPDSLREVTAAFTRQDLMPQLRYLGKHAIHAHDVGWQDNLVFFFVALYFCMPRDLSFALDNWLF